MACGERSAPCPKWRLNLSATDLPFWVLFPWGTANTPSFMSLFALKVKLITVELPVSILIQGQSTKLSIPACVNGNLVLRGHRPRFETKK